MIISSCQIRSESRIFSRFFSYENARHSNHSYVKHLDGNTGWCCSSKPVCHLVKKVSANMVVCSSVGYLSLT
jgi:hypothetical protein